MKTCSRCDKASVAKGLCRTHYNGEKQKQHRAAVRSAARSCQTCERDITGRDPRTMFCSPTCKDRTRNDARQAAVVAARGTRTCQRCGQAIADDRHGQSRYCSSECYTKDYNQAKAAQLKRERLAKVGPCRICNAKIPESRTARAVYCSDECQQRAAAIQQTVKGYTRRRAYGITPDEYAALLESQGGVCAICKQPETTKRGGLLVGLAVDHDHGSGRVRGILCTNCNQGLGRFADDPARLRAAGDYLSG